MKLNKSKALSKTLGLGRRGESLAAQWLEQRGFSILHRNWRHGHCELDLVAAKDGRLHFVEVKSRTNHLFGKPEESVDHKKLERLMSAAAGYLEQYPDWIQVQYDVLGLVFGANGTVSFFLVEDVYE